MNLLTAKEAKKIKREVAFVDKIAHICEAFAKGLMDRTFDKPYEGNSYKNKAERVAYTYGWNRNA